MGFSPQTKINIQKVIVITFCWLFIGVFLSLYNTALLTSPFFSKGIPETYNFKTHLLIYSFISFFGGIIGGTILVTINAKLFRKKSFGYALITTAYSYVLLYIILLLLFISLRVKIALGNNFSVVEFKTLAWEMLQNFTIISNFILWGTIALFTLFLLQVNDQFGPGILRQFIMGKYHHPKKEERIFMFLDMKSSTTIAEKIGNEKYFDLLRNIFSSLTDSILNNQGEIYQYVGDEIVISWGLKNGSEKAHCLHCFYDIKMKLEKLSSYHQKKYGIAPVFKAGLHSGVVMAGEIGGVKKDIIYAGDVLNTTARIQSKCNEYKIDFLVSEETLNLISNIDKKKFKLTSIGSIVLKGKNQKINLTTVEINSTNTKCKD